MKARRQIKIFPSAGEMTVGAAELIVEKLSETLRNKSHASFVLSGGSTPKALYELLASEKYRNKISWENILIFFGDERCVPPDDQQSNYKMAHDTLLSKVSLPEENVFRMRGEIDPEEAIKEYEKKIIKALGNAPVFDIVLLGLGTDGHTASLFPGTPTLNENEKLVTANYVKKLDTYRLTLTLPAINSAKNIIFLVAGHDKAETVQAVFDENSDPPLPSQLVAPANGNISWFLDKSAASLIQ